MSDAERGPGGHEDDEEGARQGPSLTLMYSLIALALALAIGFALMIVTPFHHRH